MLKTPADETWGRSMLKDTVMHESRSTNCYTDQGYNYKFPVYNQMWHVL